MPKTSNPRDDVLARRAAARVAGATANRRPVQLSPADGSVARFEHHVSVYCAPCHRWIDCNEGVPPEVAHQRHGALFH